MSEPIYRQALAKAWSLTWRNKSLWALGLLSALFAGSYSLQNFISQLMDSVSENRAAALASLFAVSFPPLAAKNIIGLVWLGFICLAVGLAVIFISICAKTSLLIAVADFYKHKAAPTLSKIWNESLKFFWRMFSLEISRKIILFALAIGFGCGWVALSPFQSYGRFAIGISALILALLLALAVSATAVYAAGYAVIDNERLGKSIVRGWTLFKNHLLVSFEVSLLLLILDFILVVVIAGVAVFYFVPSIFLWLTAGVFNSGGLAIAGFFLGLIAVLLLVVLVGAIYNTFYVSSWMYLFLKMHHEGIASRMFHHLKKWFR